MIEEIDNEEECSMNSETYIITGPDSITSITDIEPDENQFVEDGTY